jgi:16S rRNA (guanine527-N7)-methyltransferase
VKLLEHNKPSELDRDQALARYPVSRETADRLVKLVDELVRWQAAKNLVSGATMRDVWTRHILDSLQLIDHAPSTALRWLDLGSGGGFPGLVIAIQLMERPGASIDLVESNGRKCAFLNHVSRLLGLPAKAYPARIEAFLARPEIAHYDVVTARALAPLSVLIGWSEKLLTRGSIALFPKGQDVVSELTACAKSTTVDLELLPSLTHAEARIVRASARRVPRGSGLMSG